MISTSKTANKNYLAKVVKLKNIRKHENADRLQVVSVDFQTVITGLEAKDGDIYVFFPCDSKLNNDYLSYNDEFRHKELNQDKTKGGFFEDNCRVKSIKLRGEKSFGYIVPAESVEHWGEVATGTLSKYIDQEFDTINGKLIIEKYVVKLNKTSNKRKEGQKPKANRLIDGQVKFHISTENLRKNAFKIHPDDQISVTYKLHGCNAIISNVLVKKKLNLIDNIARFLGINIQDTEYDVIWSSRKVVKNKHFNDEEVGDGYYGVDVWGNVAQRVKDKIPKGLSIYGEIVGYTKEGSAIQSGYDYGCKQGENELYVFRITITNADGLSVDLSDSQIREFCKEQDLKVAPLIYKGRAGDMYDISEGELWNEEFIKRLEEDHTDKRCHMCVNNVVEEGIVIRKERMFSFDAYKLKGFEFINNEGNFLDKGEENIDES